MNRGAAWTGRYAGLAQDRDRLALLQSGLDRAQLPVDVAESRQLGEHERIVALAELMEVEDQASEVSIGELAGLAQEANAPTSTTTRAEPRLLGC